MRINSAGSTNINLLQSDAFTFRNQDYVVSQQGAFFRGIDLPATSAQYCKAQLFNPSGSGITVILDRVIVSATAAGTLSISNTSTQLSGGSSAGANNLLGGAGSQATRKYEISAGSVSTAALVLPVAANSPLELPFPFPILIEENDSLFIRPAATNRGMNVSFFWREV